MRVFLRILLVFLLCVLCACSSIHSLQLNTMRPAKVTYHISQPHVAVINNSEVPDGSSYSRYIDENGKRYRLSYNADSIPSFFTMSLASQLYDRRFFETVEVFFPDSADISGVEGVSEEKKKEWTLHNPEVVNVVVNELRPQAILQTETLDGVFGVKMVLATKVLAQCIIPQREDVDIAVADTLVWYAYGETPQMARMELPMFEICLEEALSLLAMKVADYLTPHERVAQRYIFVTGHAAMSDAYRYWSDGRYDEASYVWEYVYENARENGRKAKAAANLAVYYELEDNYVEALKYARQARSLFIEERYVGETEYIGAYCKDLDQRIKEGVILDATL